MINLRRGQVPHLQGLIRLQPLDEIHDIGCDGDQVARENIKIAADLLHVRLNRRPASGMGLDTHIKFSHCVWCQAGNAIITAADQLADFFQLRWK